MVSQEEAPVWEIRHRADYCHKQALKWSEAAVRIAFADGGVEKYAYGMARVKDFERQARELEALLI